jgi:predicted DsbA family dithiol-disulfide isomerase
VHVEIWSDIACPWCYVGKRRFETALAQFERRGEVEVHWRSFQLDPGSPAERPGAYRDLLARKYRRTPDEAQAMLDEMTARGAAEGLDIRFDRVRAGSTRDAHRLVHLAREHGLADAAKERLFRAYFTEGELLADPEVLRRLGGELGLPAEEVDDLLASDRFAQAVGDEQELAYGFGVQGVPFFAVDRARGASGAQDPEVLLALLRGDAALKRA